MKKFKKALSSLLAFAIVLSCWVWIDPHQHIVEAANEAVKDHYLFAYFTGTSLDGQKIHLAVSDDGYNYTALNGNKPILLPSKGVGNVRDPYIWYDERTNEYYILATDLDFTDGGNSWGATDYSENSTAFIVWRSKDLVNWYDETFIDVSKMGNLIGDVSNMKQVWAPQVLYDGTDYVVYFTLSCNATSWLDIVYLKTSDLFDQSKYYEFGYLIGKDTENSNEISGYGCIDADIIYNPNNKKYYLFYKVEANNNELGTTDNNTSLKTIFYYVGDSPTGPFTNPGTNVPEKQSWANCGFSVFPNLNVSLEGCNSFFDNDGNLIMYVDEYEKSTSYFRIAKTSGDFTNWEYPDVSRHNINSLSPRHGSVVKITEEEYNRLLANTNYVTSSSLADGDKPENHLVGRFFTTADATENKVSGKPGLTVTGLTMQKDPTGQYRAFFNGSSHAELDFDSLFSNSLNYKDGFTITFTMINQNSGKDQQANKSHENHDRVYEITNPDINGNGCEDSADGYYSIFSPSGTDSGAYLGTYNGPSSSGDAHAEKKFDRNGIKRHKEAGNHEYIISYANGNTMVYCDGNLIISRNRFSSTAVVNDDTWYNALGTKSIMRIGKSSWASDPLFVGYMYNLCIYDCSLSYYDAKAANDKFGADSGWINPDNHYTGDGVPRFNDFAGLMVNETKISSDNKNGTLTYVPSERFSNILYTEYSTDFPTEGKNPTTSQAFQALNSVDFGKDDGLKVGIYYSPNTVLLYDGVSSAIIPVMVAGRIDKAWYSRGYYKGRLHTVYPTTSSGGDLGDLSLTTQWYGWTTNSGNYVDTVINQDGTTHRIGHNSSTKLTSQAFVSSDATHLTDSHRKIYYYASSLKVDNSKINFNGATYKTYKPDWHVEGDSHKSYSTAINKNVASKNNIHLYDYRGMVNFSKTITQDYYNSVMNNSNICPELKTKYAAAVYAVRNFHPGSSFDYKSSATNGMNQLTADIQAVQANYNAIKAKVDAAVTDADHGHYMVTYPARDATCALPGLTEGKECAICGKVFKTQQVLPGTVEHTFGEVKEEENYNYQQCSVCGTIIKFSKHTQIRYENLFSLNDWYSSPSNAIDDGLAGVIETDTGAAGTVKITNNQSTEVYTKANAGNAASGSNYAIPVTGGGTYVLRYTAVGNGQIFLFKHDKNGNIVGNAADVNKEITDRTDILEFTVESETKYLEIRFDGNVNGDVIYSNIGVYTKDSYDKLKNNMPPARVVKTGAADEELFKPSRYDTAHYFGGWKRTNGDKVNIDQITSDVILYAIWVENTNSLDNDTVVIDYTLPVDIAVLNNDKLVDGSKVTAIGKDVDSSATLGGSVYDTSQLKDAGKTIKLNNGEATLNADNNTITYTPNTITMSDVDVFYYEVLADGYYCYAKVTVIPATTIYFEDDKGFFEFKNSTATDDNGETHNYIWESIYTTLTNATVNDKKQHGKFNVVGETDYVYGFDPAYDGNVTYSGGSAHFVEVDEFTRTDRPKAEFTFTGTGFDLFSLCDNESGTFMTTIYREDGSKVKNFITNTYFGYEYDNDTGKYVPTTENNPIYQVPVIQSKNLRYGTYTVVLEPVYSTVFDFAKKGSCKFYIDSVRIYDPMGTNNAVANEAYKADGEYGAQYLKIRDAFIATGSAEKSAFFLDGRGNSGTFDDFKKFGPKNEVYLAKDNSIAFDLTIDAKVIPSTIQIGLKLTGMGKDSTATVKLVKNDGSYQDISVNSATERYYSIKSIVEWEPTGNGTYKTKTPVVITNTSDCVVSITSLKWAFDNSVDSATKLAFTSDDSTYNLAVAALYRLNNPDIQNNPQNTFLSKDNISLELSESNYVVGDKGVLKITTLPGVAGVTVNGEDVKNSTTNADGKIIWSYEFEADTAGVISFNVIARDSNGTQSETLYSTASVQALPETPTDPTDPEDPETPDEPTDPTDSFFDKLIDGIRSIGEIIKNAVGADSPVANFFNMIFKALASVFDNIFGGDVA